MENCQLPAKDALVCGSPLLEAALLPHAKSMASAPATKTTHSVLIAYRREDGGTGNPLSVARSVRLNPALLVVLNMMLLVLESGRVGA
jgi:hypothetical protein